MTGGHMADGDETSWRERKQIASQYETVDRIRRSHRAATPNPAENPAWANCHMDCGVLLAEIDRLRADLELLQRAGVTVRDSRHGTRMVVIESSPDNQ